MKRNQKHKELAKRASDSSHTSFLRRRERKEAEHVWSCTWKGQTDLRRRDRETNEFIKGRRGSQPAVTVRPIAKSKGYGNVVGIQEKGQEGRGARWGLELRNDAVDAFRKKDSEVKVWKKDWYLNRWVVIFKDLIHVHAVCLTCCQFTWTSAGNSIATHWARKRNTETLTQRYSKLRTYNELPQNHETPCSPSFQQISVWERFWSSRLLRWPIPSIQVGRGFHTFIIV